MNKTVTVVQGLLTVMREQERGGTRSQDEHQKLLATVDEAILGAQLYVVSVSGQEKEVVKTLLEAMQMQQRREREELHLTAEHAIPIWHNAKLAGEAYVIAQSSARFGHQAPPETLEKALAGKLPVPPEAQLPVGSEFISSDTPGVILDVGTQTRDIMRGVYPSAGGTDINPALTAALANAATFQWPQPEYVVVLTDGVPPENEPVAVRYLKQRAESMARGLQQFGLKIKHGQALRVLASMEGYTSFASLRQALDKHAPNFCPHCGAAGTLKKVDTVFCEQGEHDGKSYEAEGEGAQYACTRCNGQFTDWSGL